MPVRFISKGFFLGRVSGEGRDTSCRFQDYTPDTLSDAF